MDLPPVPTRWRDGEMKLAVMGMLGNHNNGWVLFHYLLNHLQRGFGKSMPDLPTKDGQRICICLRKLIVFNAHWIRVIVLVMLYSVELGFDTISFHFAALKWGGPSESWQCSWHSSRVTVAHHLYFLYRISIRDLVAKGWIWMLMYI